MPDGARSKIFIVLAIVIFLGLLGGLVSLMSNNSALNRELAKAKNMAKKLESDITVINKEKEGFAQEQEKLQADATSYLAINTRVTQEKEKLQEALKDAKKTLQAKEDNLERMRISLQNVERDARALKGTGAGGKLETDVKRLEKKITELEKGSVKDKATFYYNLGVAYTQAKYYDEALDSYERSLKLDNSNAEAHYNLALIYKSVKGDPDKAIEHYRAYLRLKPDAPDKEEVEALISNMR